MKKILLFLFAAFLAGGSPLLKAQCYGTVNYDASVNGNGASTFTLTTANANEMILISLDGWGPADVSDPGPVTVDGNNATLVTSAINGNSSEAEVWAYSAPAAGAHTIVCPETNFETPYYLNFAAAFYSTGSCTPLSLSNLTSVENTVTDSTGGVIFNNITTTAPNSIIYCDATFNTGNTTSYPISWNNAGLLADLHEGDGVEGSDAYQAEATAGTYTITARNSSPYTGGGGLNLILVDITPPACSVAVTAVATTEPTCGGNNGTATASATGGSTPYTYLWSPSGGSNATATGLSAGTYTITVTDHSGCTGTASVTLTATSGITTTTTFTNVLCSGGNTGSASVTATGGTTPYTYLWSPTSKTTQTATGLSAGTYTITVTDKNGCTATNTVTISQPALLNASTSSTSATCGQSNGSATVTLTGGTSPYTYLWSPGGGTTATISGISAGTYTVTVYDANGCNVNASVSVANSSGINTSISSFTDVLCNGASTGSATVTASGGTTPYTYLWSPSGGTNATATGLSAGDYTVTVTDANGCSTPAIAIITQPKAVRDSISSVTNPLCNGGTGSATVGVTGGITPYTYSWAPSGGSNATATGLSVGSYTITVTDNNGCQSTVTVSITQPTPITATYTTTPTTCGNFNGSITATVTGGTSPYTYLWAPGGQTTATATGLSAGTYTITITDANGCSRTGTATIAATSSPTVTVSSSANDKCNGNTNGSATVSVSGGTSPYTYLWAPGGSTTATESNLSAGTYTITVHDANGCITTTTVTITQPNPITGTFSNTSVLCNGGTASTTVTVSGGTSPFTYSWSTVPVQTTATATGLSAGTYTVTITDINGCSGTASVTLTQPTVLRDSISAVTYPTCSGGTGTATVGVTGGTTPYTYSWSTVPVQTTATATGLSAGTYTITVTDKNGCDKTATVTITQPTPITVTTTITQATCGNNNGSATAIATGGSSPYTYSWTTVPVQTTATATGLSAGTYTITVTDHNGCTGTASATIIAISSPTVTVSSLTNDKCNGNSNGSATVSVTGGTSPYTYLWTPGGYTTATVSTLSAGTYTVTVHDANGCTATTTLTITQPTPVAGSATSTGEICNGGNTGTATVTATGGTTPYTYLWNPSGQTNATATGLSAGTYTVTITDNNGCTGTVPVSVTQPAAIRDSVSSITYPLCNGGTGSATIGVTDGVSPYTYLWNPSGGTNATETGLSAGIYTVTVTDNHGCTGTVTVTITQPAAIAAPPTVTNITCNGLNNGSASVSPTGGTSPYTYAWSPVANTTSSLSGLSAGSYTIVVTDANGCSVTTTFSITEPAALSGSITSTPAGCINNGTATETPSGGTAPYTYSWSPSGQTNATATGLSAGTYTVTVTDANGCSEQDLVVVGSTSTLAIIASNSDELCNGASTATATVSASGGTSPYTYLWTPGGGTTTTITGLSAGNYTIVVTDNTGCTQSAVVTVTQPASITAVTSSTGAGCSNNAGSVTVTATGGTGAYTYLWAPGSGTTATVSGLGSGTYTVTVTDANGCSETATATVANGGVSGAITATTNVACFGGNTGSATVTASGNATPFTYLWTPGGQNTATATGLSAGTYTVTVTDNNGCTFSTTVTITGPSSAIAETHVVTSASCNSSNNGSITLTVSGGTPQYTYTWSNGSTTENQSNLLPGEYVVTIKDSNGCTLVDSMNVGASLSVFANAGSDTVICYNSTIALNGAGSINATGYAWYVMPGMVLIKDTSVVFVTPTNDTTTYVLVVSNGACTDTSSVTIVTLPALSLDPGPDQVIYGTGTVTLGGSPTATSYTSLVWEPSGTLNDSILANPSATPTVTTVYTVSVENSAGCKASDTVTVFVLPGIMPPSGFTPNGDGVNDYWVLGFAVDFPNIEVEVYNRWGELLFHSDGYNTPWDGTYDGKPVPIGTYYYIINLNDPRFPKAMTGPLTILR